MSRSFKVSLDDGSGNKEVFAIKLSSENFENLREELFVRKPDLRNKKIIFFYEDSDGDKIGITKASDFEIFLEQDINKLFAEAKDEPSAWQPLNQALLNTVATSPPSSNSNSLYAKEIRSIFHEGILCDVCDKEIYGFRYKCMNCEEFDMCMDCEPKQIHKEHLLLRITNPIDGCKNLVLRENDDEDDEDDDEHDDSYRHRR